MFIKQIYIKMKLSDKILQNNLTPYQRIGKEFGVSAKFVGMIARGERKPQRGKGLMVYNRIKELVGETSN